MDNEKLKAILLLDALLYKAKEVLQGHDLCGGHRGWLDEAINTAQFEIDEEINKQ